jgi:hypothetical protein
MARSSIGSRPSRLEGARLRTELGAKKAREVRYVERLGDERYGAAVSADELPFAEVIRARKDDAGVGVAFAQEAGELNAVGAGHHEVDDRKVEVLRLEHAKRAVSVHGRLDVESLNSQADCNHPGVVRFVIDD